MSGNGVMVGTVMGRFITRLTNYGGFNKLIVHKSSM